MNMGAALWLARELGPEYRAAFPNANWDCPSNRFQLNQGSEWDDTGTLHPMSYGVPAAVIRPAKREVSLIEALHWAAQDESRTFEQEGLTYRVRNGIPQWQHKPGGHWHRADDSGAWDMACTIDEGWEDVTAQVRVVVE